VIVHDGFEFSATSQLSSISGSIRSSFVLVDIELITHVDQLKPYVSGWEALADRVSQPRCGGAIVYGWARHMMDPDVELRIWIALDGSEVVGVLPFAAERMQRNRIRLLPPVTDMMYGALPIADPDRTEEVVAAIAEDFRAQADVVDMASIFWLPEGSPWVTAIGDRLAEPDWVRTAFSRYCSYYTDIGEGKDAWLAQRDGDFRREVRRRARRGAEQGFQMTTMIDPSEIIPRLPQLQTFYLRRKAERGGEGYRFDDDMSAAIEDALELSTPGRFGLSVLERDDLIIGMQFVLRAGIRMSSWMTGYDPAPEWSRLGTGIATLLEALDAGAQAGCEILDLGVGDEPYKETFQDASLELESLTWCRSRLARLLQLTAPPSPGPEGGEGAL
jgi:CelD/BcsL family acetyltransferase involved in cellulose biosynthesis